MALSTTHNHYDTFREELAKAYPGFGHALWEPDPGEDPPVEVGDVGFIREGQFHRLFNALLPGDHESHLRFGVPEYHEPLRPTVTNHINRRPLSPNMFYSSGVTMLSGGFEVLAATTIGSADISFTCTRQQGAALSLPVTARREDTIFLGHFRKWIIKHIDTWLAFAHDLGVGIEMEDIVLVTGCHRTRSWSNITFNEVQAGAQFSLGVEVAGALGASINWRASNLRIQGAVLSHGPSGENLPENQCIFVRGFRVKRIIFGIPRIKGAAGPKPDPRGNDSDCEPEKEVVSIPSDTEKYRDPLHILLKYIAKRAPDCDMALVHDDDMEVILGLGAGSSTSSRNLQSDAVMNYLERSKPEIESVSHSLSADDTTPGTDREHMTVAMLSAQLKSLAFESSIGDIVKTIERFRILVVGRSGVGKSSLINCVFGIHDASVAHYKPGESDIRQEFVSPENKYFVLHDSKGFEPGDLSNYETVRTFIEQGSQQHLPMIDRIHGLWLCVETPTAGGRVFEKGDEYLLKFAHDIQIPVVLVFTQYDRLVRSKKAELQEEDENLDEISLRNQSEKNATIAFNKCLQSLQRALGRLNIPMPHCARVSVRKGYQESVSTLVESTRDVVRDRLGGDAWIMWSIAQRASPSVKMEACITKGMSSYLPGGMPGSERLLLQDCLAKVHRDIITCWNFKGEVLDSKEFAYLMLRLSQDVQTESGASHSNIDLISRFVTLVTSASPPTQPLESILDFAPNFLQSFSTAVLENTSWLQRFLMTYTVDLVSVLRKLFDNTLTATWDGVQEAYGAYEQSGTRQKVHDRILSTTAQGDHVLTKGDMNGVFRGLFVM